MNRTVTASFIVAGIISMYILFVCATFASGGPSILFIHHSVGNSLIRDGSVREILTEAGFDFWDHGYNDSKSGLRNVEGKAAGCYWIPDNNTNPDGFANLFSLSPHGDNAFSKILKNHDVILFKSCFPTSKIADNNRLKDLINPKRRSIYNYKRHYLTIRKTVDQYPEKIFIIVTQPPLHPDITNQKEAQRARTFVEWLQSKDYLGDRENLFVFDYFDLLADPKTNTLHSQYMINPQEPNSHPNPIANMLIGPIFADFIVNIFRYRKNSNLPRVTFDIPQWPYKLIRLFNHTVTLSGKLISDKPIREIFWSDLKGHSGDLSTGRSWSINDLTIGLGVTKVLVTAINEQGLRSSSVVGLKYYSGKAKEAIIFDESLKHGKLYGFSYSDENPYVGKKHLVIMGNGQRKRAAINGIALDISDFDPQTSHLEIHYDQGPDKTKPKLSIPGIGSLSMDVDDKPGYEKIIIPFDRFRYVYNILDHLIIRGDWGKNTKVYLDSMKIICFRREP